MIILIRFILIMIVGIAFVIGPSYASAPTMDFTVNMSEAVTVDITGGTPRIAINVGGVTRYATYASGTGTSALTFTYTATAGDVDLDGVTVSSPIDLNGGTITDLAGNALSTLIFTPPTTTNVKVDYPSMSMNFANGSTGRYTLSGNSYTTLSSFLTAAGTSFTRGTTATYFDSTGTLQTAAINTPRFDYHPSTLAFRGLLMEGSRTNSIRNSTMVGAVAGSPGTIPTNWQLCNVGGGASCTYSIQSVSAVSGMSYVDIRFQGSMPASGAYASLIILDNSTSTSWLTVTNTDFLSGQIRLANISGTIPFTSISFVVSEQNSSTYLTNRTLRSITVASLSGTLTHFSGSATASNASVNNVIQPRLVIGSNGSITPYDFTLRIATPQVEKGSFPTSFIPTTSAALARSSDVMNIPTGAWYNQSAGSFFGDVGWESSSGTSFPMFSRFDDTTNNNRWNLFYNQSANRVGVDAYTLSANQGSFSSAIQSTIGTIKASAAQSSNSANAAYNGTLGTLDTTWSTPTVTQWITNASNARIWVKNFKYYPLRITDTQLQLLTQ